MVGAVLEKRQWTRPVDDSSYDHDHCEFCSATFSDAVEGAFSEGYTTEDEACWVCADCFDNPSLRAWFRLSLRTG